MRMKIVMGERKMETLTCNLSKCVEKYFSVVNSFLKTVTFSDAQLN